MGKLEKLKRSLKELKDDAQAKGKVFLDHEGAVMSVADQILEISVGLILVGAVEVIGIGMIVNASTSTWDPNVKTMFTVVLVILAIIADVYIFMNAVKKVKR